MNATTPLDFDFPAFPEPSRVSTAIARLSPLTIKECDLVAKRVENGRLTPEEQRELAEVYRQLEVEGALAETGEVRELHPDRKPNIHD